MFIVLAVSLLALSLLASLCSYNANHVSVIDHPSASELYDTQATRSPVTRAWPEKRSKAKFPWTMDIS